MNQIPSSVVVPPRGGVNPGTAVAILVAFAFCSAVTFIGIAESVFPGPAASHGRPAFVPEAPAVLPTGDDSEIATMEPPAPDEAAPATDRGSETPASNAATGGATGRGGHPVRSDGSARRDRPTPADTATPPAAPHDSFGQDDDDPLGDLDFGPLITG